MKQYKGQLGHQNSPSAAKDSSKHQVLSSVKGAKLGKRGALQDYKTENYNSKGNRALKGQSIALAPHQNQQQQCKEGLGPGTFLGVRPDGLDGSMPHEIAKDGDPVREEGCLPSRGNMQGIRPCLLNMSSTQTHS